MGFYNVIGHGIALDLVSLVKAQAVGMTEGAEVDNFAFWTTWGSRSNQSGDASVACSEEVVSTP